MDEFLVRVTGNTSITYIMPSHSKVTSVGCLLKDTPPVELTSATQGTIAGKSFVDPNVTSMLLTQVAS